MKVSVGVKVPVGRYTGGQDAWHNGDHVFEVPVCGPGAVSGYTVAEKLRTLADVISGWSGADIVGGHIVVLVRTRVEPATTGGWEGSTATRVAVPAPPPPPKRTKNRRKVVSGVP